MTYASGRSMMRNPSIKRAELVTTAGPPDNDATGVSLPKSRGPGIERGQIAIQITGQTETDTYKVRYKESDKSWNLIRLSDVEVATDTVESTGNGTQWEIEMDGVKVSIEQNHATDYSEGFTYDFGVFKTDNPQGKSSSVGLGEYNISDNP